MPLGDYVASNTDECTATLMYAVSLKQSGTVTFEYIYPDSSIVFEFFVGDGGRGEGYGSLGTWEGPWGHGRSLLVHGWVHPDMGEGPRWH